MEEILISACLVGQKVRYDGASSDAPGDWIERWRRQGRLVPICPEVVGGLAVPRPAAELVGGDGGDVLDGRARLETEDGTDVTEAFVAGARHAWTVARTRGIRMAVLKARSPSCGTMSVYDGTFSGNKRPGTGVTAALLRRNGIAAFNEDQLEEAAAHLAQLQDHNGR